MTLGYHPDLRDLALEATVNSPASFSILGHRFDTDADQMLRLLESELYYRLYCGAAEPRSLHTEDPAESAAFIGALSRANKGAGTWEPGWKIAGEADGATVPVTRDGIAFWTDRSQVRTAEGRVSPGELCSVRVGKEMRHLLFGFYMALGNEFPGDGARGSIPLVRLYWHLTPDAACPYMQEVTGRLNGAGIPFQTKVVSHPHKYLRRDSGVLYLPKAEFGRAAPILQEIYRTVRAGLRPEVPLFTKRLAPGLGLAEDPGSGLSFGQSRCRVAAQGLWQGHLQGLTDPDSRLGAIAEAFRAEGIDPRYPYLESGSADTYAIDLESGTEEACT